MPVFRIKERLHSVSASKKIGLPNQLGTIIFGWSEFGDDNPYSGIYINRFENNRRQVYRINFPNEYNLNTGITMASKTKFKNAILAWQALSGAQKKEYNRLAFGRQMSGYNYFVHEYMLL